MGEHIVIIGAGQAGVQAVQSLRTEGYTGPITLVGDEPFPPYQRPPLSKAYLAGDFVRERLFLKPDSFFVDSNCTVTLSTRATSIDRKAKIVSLSDGRTIAYSKILICTGTRVRPIPVPGADLQGVYYLRGIEDVDQLRPVVLSGAGKKLVVIGAGFIGLEVAAVAKKHGLDVTVIEFMERVMARSSSPQLSAFYEKIHRDAGVKLMLKCGADSIEGENGKVVAVHAGGQRVEADAVLVGIGVLPNSEIAQDAGIVCDNGIVVDEYTATSDPDIFAAGDCTNHPAFAGGRMRLESVQNAIDQAKVAAAGMAGKPRAYKNVPWNWSDQYDLKLQLAGIANPTDTQIVRGDPATKKFAVFHMRDGAVAAVESVNAAPEYIIGRKLIESGVKIDPAQLADVNVPMKSFG